MIFLFIMLYSATGCSCADPALRGKNQDIVDVTSVDSTFVIDIRYATANNFTKHVLYPVARAKLRREAAESLASANHELRQHGLRLKIYDGYRPLAIQWKLWEIVPNPDYVADPRKGSRHNRGAAVDVTIVDSTGSEIPMPTPYDDFTERAWQGYMNLPDDVLKNREMLKTIMMRHGFLPIKSEWWHFDFHGWDQFDILDEPL